MQKRILRGLICIMMMLSIICGSVISTSAHYKASNATAEGNNPKYWRQLGCRWSNEPLNGRSGDTIGSAGSAEYALGYAFYKAGDTNKNPYYSVIKPARSKGLIDNRSCISFSKVNKIDSNFTYSGHVSLNLKYSLALRYIKDYLSRGYYIIAAINGYTRGTGYYSYGHYVFIDGINTAGNLFIGDSGFSQGLTLETLWKSNSVTVLNLQLFKHKTRPSYTRNSVYGCTAWASSKPSISSSSIKSNGLLFTWNGNIVGNRSHLYGVYYKRGNSWVRLATVRGNCYVDTTIRKGQSRTYTIRGISSDKRYFLTDFNKTGWTLRR